MARSNFGSNAQNGDDGGAKTFLISNKAKPAVDKQNNDSRRFEEQNPKYSSQFQYYAKGFAAGVDDLLNDDGEDDEYEAKWRKRERQETESHQILLIKHHQASAKAVELASFEKRLDDQQFEMRQKLKEEEQAKAQPPIKTQFLQPKSEYLKVSKQVTHEFIKFGYFQTQRKWERGKSENG